MSGLYKEISAEMKITKENLNQAIGALKQCSRENKDRHISTGCIRVSDLCDDLITYLEEPKYAFIVINSSNDSIASQAYSSYGDAEKTWKRLTESACNPDSYRIAELRIL